MENRLAQFPLFRPPFLTSNWQFETIAQDETYAGRLTRRVRATRPVNLRGDPTGASTYWPWLHEYECLVDDSLQIVLHLAGMGDGASAVTVAAEEVHVDGVFPADLFELQPPAGTKIMYQAPS
jgi:hypothetical protein